MAAKLCKEQHISHGIFRIIAENDYARDWRRETGEARLLSLFLCLSPALFSKFVDMTISPSLLL